MTDTRDWIKDLRALGEPSDRARRAELEAAIADSTPVTLSHDEITADGVFGGLPLLSIMLGATKIGIVLLEDKGETLWIGKIGIDGDLRSSGYGQRAIEILASLAGKQKYRRLEGEIQAGPADLMERRRQFFRKCGFTVNTDDKVELHLSVPRRMFARRPLVSGDWTVNPWFTDPQHAERLWSMRYDGTDLTRVREVLEVVYPAPFCSDYLDRIARAREPASNKDAAIRKFRQRMALGQELHGLFEPHGPVSDILALGVDLVEVLKEKQPRRWLDRFQNPSDVAGVCFEVELWANALRSDIKIAHVPEKSGKHVGLKTPDFTLVWKNCPIGIEAKGLSVSEHDMVRHEYFPLIHPLPPDDREYHVQVAPEIQSLAGNPEGRARYRVLFPDVEDALATKKWELEQAGSPFGDYEVPGAGRIRIAERDPEFRGQSATVSFTTEASQEEKARRLLPHLQDAASKFRLWPGRAGRITIAVIDVPMDYNPDAVHGVLAAEVRSNPSLYRDTEAVVWRRIALQIDAESDPWKTYQYFACFAMRFPWCAMPIGQLGELSRLLLASPHRLMAPLRYRDRADLVPDVATSTKVWTSTI